MRPIGSPRHRHRQVVLARRLTERGERFDDRRPLRGRHLRHDPRDLSATLRRHLAEME